MKVSLSLSLSLSLSSLSLSLSQSLCPLYQFISLCFCSLSLSLSGFFKVVATLVPPLWRVYDWLDSLIYSHYQRVVMRVLYTLGNTQIWLSGAAPQKENAICISNHQCSVDPFMIDAVAYHGQRLGNMQFIVKAALKYVPILGSYWHQHGFVFIRRQWAKDSGALARSLGQLETQQRPYWICIYPEGTRRPDIILPTDLPPNVPVYEHVLAPRYRGFVACVQQLQQTCDSIYDVTIAFHCSKHPHERPAAPSLHDMMSPRWDRVCIHTQRFPVASVPKAVYAATVALAYGTASGRKYLLYPALVYGGLSYIWGIAMY
ncbi:uncharacterized protein MONBRDRAFT_29236 [Monosiga brevicollis MX1]|uniref:Phospholipid/glycerol acyltransferase domain-containing protein n=1 Tax=Monosiga brevicollis TaxID=81824 RepID=A9VAI3_MONBE|nr:uncharacterized protein MONBRDRAFT_29236 [Monosiga brevicollis MX1]EDQ85545.1 predicted protein [Monosiga brevicollis MX1]|eukprot:XP_001749736.1 hypothetical protein [Monosiga brevicollis MX1]